ncbi:MAG TPA: hypothetical protein VK543_01170 [Puia sp.]|nr:hypothetical protein [Puia sp.]
MTNINQIQGLELLQFNHAGAMQLKNGSTVNYGVIRINDKEVVYYTGKGLREMWRPNMNAQEKIVSEKLRKIGELTDGEQELITSGHIAVTPLEQIIRVVF